MVYTIEFPPENGNKLHGKVIFDIEFWLNDYKDRNGENMWYTECKISILPEGIVPLSKSVSNPDELIKDLNYIRNYRVWLNEQCKDGNRILPVEEAADRKYDLHLPELKRRIDWFCKKYGLIYNVD